MNNNTIQYNTIQYNTIQCIRWQDGIKIVPNAHVDLLVTDPPYGMGYQSGHRKIKYEKIQGDDNLDWLPDWIQSIKLVLKPNAHLYVFCSYHNVDIFKRELQKEFEVKNILIWQKNNTGMGDLEGDYAPQYEMIIFCSNGEKKLNNGRHSNILKANKTGNNNHPTEKPVSLLRFLIEKSSNKGDIVLDTFAGSFSTMQACIQTERKCISFEIEEKHCKKAQALISGTNLSLF